MSDINDPQAAADEIRPPLVIPVRLPPQRPAAATGGGGSALRTFLIIGLGMGAGVVLLLVILVLGRSLLGDGGGSSGHLTEHYHSGSTTAKDKIAIVKVDGVLLEGTTSFAQKQIERAAVDDQVKVVVLRINSPGGSITASDDLYKRIIDLRDGNVAKPKGKSKPKKVVVSMGAVAASGGYYIAVPSNFLMAEVTTITGSIGVYAAFPNISGLATKYGFGMDVIKAGDIKDSGSMFHPMSTQERQLWQGMVDSAYQRFIEVVEKGRASQLKKGQLTEILFQKQIPQRDEKGNVVPDDDGNDIMVTFVRRRADGGIFTAQEALDYKLIDGIGYLDDAVKKAASEASLGDDYKVITYERPPTLSGLLLGVEGKQPAKPIDASLSEAAAPRLWYLAPQSELAGILAATGR